LTEFMQALKLNTKNEIKRDDITSARSYNDYRIKL